MEFKKIWIVTELFYPEETAVAFIFTRIANFLSKKYKICVICGPEFYDNEKRYVDNQTISSEIEIHRTGPLNLDKNSLIQRTIKVVVLSFRMAILICRKISKGETVILSTNPAFLLLIVRFIKLFKKIQLHILVHDVFPENTIPAKIFESNRNIIYKLIKYLFDKAYSSADHLIVIGRDMKQIISKKVTRFKMYPPISVVPNWTNPENFFSKNTVANRDNNIILQYAGNIGRVQGLKELLDAFRLSNNTRLILNIVGTGALYSYIENYIKKFNIENIHVNGSFSRNSENEILANCDIGIVSLSVGMYGLGVPSKSYNLLSAGKPILFIGEPGTEIFQLVLENGVGWPLDINNQSDIIEFFNNLDSIDKSQLISMGQKARSLAEKEYNESTILKLMQIKLESIKV